MATPNLIDSNAVSVYPVVQEPIRNKKASTLRFAFLDGMRGLAALYVIFDHVIFTVFKEEQTAGLSPLEYWIYQLGAQGHYAVVLFIVLSGFSLMMPVVRTADGALSGGFKGYVIRRSRRILPPYYAAVFIVLILIALIPGLHQMRGTRWDGALPVWTTGNIVSHLLLVYNASPAWFQKIERPLWSVAVEWQIYFVFALLLLPIYRRFGWIAATVAGVIGGLLPRVVFYGKYDYSQLHFLGLFAFGMAGAVQFAAWTKTTERKDRNRFWNATLLLLCVMTVIVLVAQSRWHGSHSYLLYVLSDWVPGAAMVCLLVKLAEQKSIAASGSRFCLINLFESKLAVTLGLFSYSIYLIHDPIVTIVSLILHAVQADTNRMVYFLLLATLGTACALFGAYAFHCAFERPFLRHKTDRSLPKVTLGI